MTKPRIGIRPVIDGRWGGVRESLEEQTMNLAKAAADLIRSNLRYADGTPVECVIGNTTIGGSAEAAKVADQFASENVTATLSVTPCWCYGTETMDLDPNTIKAVWGFNGTERPGAVYLAAAMAAHAHYGLPAFAIYGRDVQDADDRTVPEDVSEKILRFARAAIAAGSFKNKAYINLGGTCMGIAGSNADAKFIQKYFGMRTEWVDMTEITRRIHLGIYDHEEYEKALAWIKENCEEGFDVNEGKDFPEIIRRSKVVDPDEDWEFIAKFTLITRDIMFGNPKLAEMGWHEESLGRNGAVCGFQGQRQWTDWLPNADFTEAINNTTFDWTGTRPPIVTATENDVLNGLTMLMQNAMSNQASIFADVRTYWSPDSVKRVTGHTLEGKAANGFIHLINSGAAALDGTGTSVNEEGEGCMKPWYDVTQQDVENMLEATDWCRANFEYFRGGGFSSHWKTQSEMPVTLARINLIDGLGPVLQIAEGWTVVLPDEVHKTLDLRTDRTWPTSWFAPRLTGEGAFRDVYSVMSNWGSNHGAFVYGHNGADMITLASMLRIPVSLHNVPEEKIYRPHAWAAFGTKDLEGADYRACENYGPMYGKK